MDNYRSKPRPGKVAEISDNESRSGNGVYSSPGENIGHEYEQREGAEIPAAIIKYPC